MSHFLDGPAVGTVLSLRRSPLFLRVVRDTASGDFDALDQLDDSVRDNEVVFAYRLVKHTGSAFICSRGRGCQQMQISSYCLCEEQPLPAVLRDNAAWREWATNQAEAMLQNFVHPRWIWGKASCGEGDAPICSRCDQAVAPSAMANHETECWKEA